MSKRPNVGKAPSGDYEVGNKKPPKEHQFKPGISGNRRGRPRKVEETQSEMFERLFSEKVTIAENGKSISISREELMHRSLFNKAMRGDIRAATFLLGLRDLYRNSGETQLDIVELSEADRELLLDHLQRTRPDSSAAAPEPAALELKSGDDSGGEPDA